jgi:hypothetical protein
MTDITHNLDLPLLFSSRIILNPDVENSHKVYNDGELEVINSFKDQYMAALSSAQRKHIAQVEMFPKLFNYWKEQGFVYESIDLRIKSNVSSSLIFISFFCQIFIRNSLHGCEIHGDPEMVLNKKN